jgi:hypothetical protein
VLCVRAAISMTSRFRLPCNRGSLLLLCAAAVLVPRNAAAQPIAELVRIGPARFEVGIDIELHRVTGAAVLPDGSVTIADAGNQRVLVFDPRGRLRASFGRRGAGPDEFRFVTGIFSVGDTIITYDPGNVRVSSWRPNGERIASHRLPAHGGRQTGLRGVMTSTEFVLYAFEAPAWDGPRTQVRAADVLLYDARADHVRPLERRRIEYELIHREGAGATGYATPFFGQAHIAAWRDGYAFIPLDSARLDLKARDGRPRSIVDLPVRPARFDAAAITKHRDSLVAQATGPTAARIRAAFSDVPTPELAPAVDDMLLVGDRLWIQARPAIGARTTRWFIVEPASGETMGYVETPASARLLAGGARTVVLLRRSELDIEIVSVHDLQVVAR